MLVQGCSTAACLVLDFVTKKYYTISELERIQKERRDRKKQQPFNSKESEVGNTEETH
tara:strand:+ start:73 stop:246 length:174 start_codon:yes stop_codon:yes gene_type:complete